MKIMIVEDEYIIAHSFKLDLEYFDCHVYSIA